MTDDDFRWQAFFQRSAEPLFLLNRGRRLLFANRAWEQCTGSSIASCRGLVCKRARNSGADSAAGLAAALAPPPEVLQGITSRVRRLVPAREGSIWSDIEFFPLRAEEGLLGVLGRITAVKGDERPSLVPLAEELVSLRESRVDRYRLDQLAGQMPALRRVGDQVRLASQTRTPLLVVGESGTGKQWLARTIHYQSAAREAAFVPVECAGLPTSTLNSLLFGPSGLLRGGGSETGRRGVAVGTLYLKEPSRLPRELQDRMVEALADPEPAWPRIMAGSGVRLAEEVRAGRLIDDLYFTLSTVVVELPPLRDRMAADLPWLVECLLERANAGEERRLTGLSPEAWEVFYAYRWPGNLRELYQVLSVARTRAGSTQIEVGDLPAYMRLAVNLEQTQGPVLPRALPLDQLLEETERRLIRLALQRAGGNKSRAAELLSIVYPRLFRRIEALGVDE
jgi:transcriptional regulator with PAS, ATPase and Fis domain